MTRRSWLALALVALVAACGRDDRPRCAHCGMYADVAPRWAAEAILEDGETLRFDTPKCLFGHTSGPGAPRTRARKVTEYYSQRLVPIEMVLFVVGSDLVGPMGKDLVPVESSRAAAFVHDHGGRTVEFDDVGAPLLETLGP